MSTNNRKNTNNPRKRSHHDALPSSSNPKPRKRRKVNEEEKSKQNAIRNKHQKFKQNIIKQRLKIASDALQYPFDETRIRPKEAGAHGIPSRDMTVSGVMYCMNRDQRVQDNWALIYAQKMALQHKVPLLVVFCLQPSFSNTTLRHYDFMVKGLRALAHELHEIQIPFTLVSGSAAQIIPSFAQQNKCNLVVTDFSPLCDAKQWLIELGSALMKINIHLAQVDAHNVVPVWVASPKQEYAARTIRSKINKKLEQYLVEFPPIIAHSFNKNIMQKYEETDWKEIEKSVNLDTNIGAVDWCKPGAEHGMNELWEFIDQRLKLYSQDRNVPTKTAVSNLSPWYHFGQLSPARAALEVGKYRSKYKESVESYLEELIVRRELSDNFCFYNANYDKVRGAFQWAQDTLEVHEMDEREYVYDLNELETYQTHDDLWNAAQKQLIVDAKMHGFLRMYWAKKILEWSETPKEALEHAIYLNDKYSIDGRDPNGYVGCMWSICGIHDQGWRERPIFGKIRYMNYAGCKRKFDVSAFVKKMGVSGATVSAIKSSRR
eukprot:530943_1